MCIVMMVFWVMSNARIDGVTDHLLSYCRICIMGLAFLIAFVTQMQAAFTRNFHYEMKEDLPVWFDWVLIVTGEPNAHTCLTTMLLRLAI